MPAKEDDEAKKTRQEEGRETEANRDRSGRNRQPHPLAAHSFPQLRRSFCRQDRGAVPGRGRRRSAAPPLDDGPPIRSLWRFTTEKRQTEEILSGLTGYDVSFNGEKLFYMRGDNWFLAPTADLKPGSPDAPQGKPVNNGGMLAMLDPRAEWKQMYRETWHIERDFFYDPHLHGLDLAKIEAKYQPYLDGLASRDGIHLSLQRNAGRDSSRPHVRTRATRRRKDAPKPGLLGADYTVDNNRYKFAKIYNGQNWTPSLTAPLTLPGINIVEGEYLLAVNGRELHATDNLDSFFDGTAGKQTVVRVGYQARWQRWARRHGGAGGLRERSAQHRLDRVKPAQGRSALRRQGRLHLHAEHRRAPATRTSTAISMPSSISRPWCSMSATTRAA